MSRTRLGSARRSSRGQVDNRQPSPGKASQPASQPSLAAETAHIPGWNEKLRSSLAASPWRRRLRVRRLAARRASNVRAAHADGWMDGRKQGVPLKCCVDAFAHAHRSRRRRRQRIARRSDAAPRQELTTFSADLRQHPITTFKCERWRVRGATRMEGERERRVSELASQ